MHSLDNSLYDFSYYKVHTSYLNNFEISLKVKYLYRR
jgi:hypothetical protein